MQGRTDGPIVATLDATMPRAFGRYVLHARLARGGMASVYLAEHRTAEGFRKWLAIKTIHAHFADDPRFVAMFHDEARLAARFDHPNICTVFDFGRIDDTYFLAMEYLPGEPLAAVVRRGIKDGDVPIAVALGVIADAARGLHAAHELANLDGSPAGVVHRDVSPQNVFVLYNGQTKVVDFGIAKFVDKGLHTVVGEVKGKPGYLAPEQLREEPVDRRADVFSLGIVLWECLTGQRLFRGDSDVVTGQLVLSQTIAPPSSVRAECTDALDRVVLRALERDPARRYQTADELALALEACARAWREPVGARETAAWMRRVFAGEIAAKEALLRDAAAADARPLEAPALPPAPRPDGGPRRSIATAAPRRRGGALALAGAAALGFGALALASHGPRGTVVRPTVARPTEVAPPIASAPSVALPAQLPTPPATTPAGTARVDASVAAASPRATVTHSTRPVLAPSPANVAHSSHRDAPDDDHRPPLRPLREYPGGG